MATVFGNYNFVRYLVCLRNVVSYITGRIQVKEYDVVCTVHHPTLCI